MTKSNKNSPLTFPHPLYEEDIPEITTEMWESGVWKKDGIVLSEQEGQQAFAEHLKRSIKKEKSSLRKISTTVRLDADILEHFRKDGKGWQTRLNTTLRNAVLERPTVS